MNVKKLIMTCLLVLVSAAPAMLLLFPSSQSGTAAASESSCPYSVIDNATIDRTIGPVGAQVNVNGHTPVRGAEGVAVDFDSSTLATLPVDPNGDFQGSIDIPSEAADGGHDIGLRVSSCPAERLVLFAGDSVTEGAFASTAETTYVSRTLEGMRQLPTGSAWDMQVYGVSGYGSLLLDDSFNSPGYLGSLGVPLFFSPRTWWKEAQPDLAVIAVGVNNLPPLDRSTRYDGTLRGYNSEDEAIAWWKTDLANSVSFLTTQKHLPASHILILGQWPFGDSDNYRGERYTGGDQEELWDRWNEEMEITAAVLGCTFVPMDDVYGPDYIPDDDEAGGDPEDLVDHEHGNSNVHPTDAGTVLFADRILSYLPGDLGGEDFSVPFEVRSQSPITISLTPSAKVPYWGSYADYLARRLSLDLGLANPGTADALQVALTDSIGTNGVICLSEMPLLVGDIPAGGQATTTIAYLVPPGVSNFRLSFMAEATDTGGWRHSFP